VNRTEEIIININSKRENLAQHPQEEELLKVYLCAVSVGACVFERSHSSLLSVVSCRSRLKCRDSSSRCAVPAGANIETAALPGRSLYRQLMQQYNRAALKMDVSSVNCG
jgi:hypothetical protein